MAKTNTSASTSSSGSSSSKGASQASSAPKQTVRSGAELREMSNARRAVIVQARQSGTYIPGNTYDKKDSYAYLALGEKGYNQYAQNKRNSIEYSRAIDYLDSGQYNSKDTMKFLNMANQMAGEDGDMVKYNEKTNSLDKTGKWGGSWLELANMLDGLYKENLWDENRNEYNKLDDEKYKLSEEQAKLKQARDNAAKSVSTGMQSGNFLGNYADTLKQVKANDARIAELDTMMSALNDDLLDKFGTDEEKAALQRLRDNKYAKVEVYDWSKYAAESHNKDADQALVNDFMDRFGRPRAYYNSEDRFIAGYESAEAGIKSGLVGAGSLIGKALDSYNATDINAETRGGSVTGAIKTKEEKEAAKQRIGLPDSPATDEYLAWYNSYDHNKDNFENLNAIKLRQLVQPELDNVNEEISAIEQRLANIDKSGRVPSDYMNGGIQEEGELVARLKELKKQQTFYNDRLLEAKGQKDETSIGYKLATDYQRDVFNHWDEVTDQLDAKSQEAIAMAKQEASAFGKLLLDMEKTGIEMGFDMVVGTFTGGSLVPMFVRVLGNESAAARRDGASLDQQIAYGLTKASIELGTEKLFGAFSKIGYGKGIAEELSERVVAQLAETPLGRSVVRAMLSMAEEGAEEGIADLLAPLADLWYRKDKSFKELFSEETANFWYDVLLGAAMGGVGFAGGVVTGQNAQANAELYGNEIDADLQARQSIANDTVRAMQEASKGNVAPIRSVADAANAGGTRALTKQNVANVANEGAAKLDRQRENSRPVTKARDKMYELAAKYPNGNIPMEERLTRQEANLLRAAGYPRDLIEEISIPRGTRPATAEEIAEGEQKRTKDIKGYVERAANTDITRRGAERGKDVDEAKGKAAEQKRQNDLVGTLNTSAPIDTSGTIDSGIKKTAAQNISGAEEQLGISAGEGQSVTARLSAIENELGITPENGSSITARIDAINKALYGENGAPSENASNAPNSQASSEGEITQEQPKKKVKPPKEKKSKKTKKPSEPEGTKAEEIAPAEATVRAETSEPVEQASTEATAEESPATEAVEQQQEEASVEEPTGLEAEIRNAKTLDELEALYDRDKAAFNEVYKTVWGDGFEVEEKTDLKNLFDDLHPSEQTTVPAEQSQVEQSEQTATGETAEQPEQEENQQTPEPETQEPELSAENWRQEMASFNATAGSIKNAIDNGVVSLEDVKAFLKVAGINTRAQTSDGVAKAYLKEKASKAPDRLTERESEQHKKVQAREANKKKIQDERAEDLAWYGAVVKGETPAEDVNEPPAKRIVSANQLRGAKSNIAYLLSSGKYSKEVVFSLFDRTSALVQALSEKCKAKAAEKGLNPKLFSPNEIVRTLSNAFSETTGIDFDDAPDNESIADYRKRIIAEAIDRYSEIGGIPLSDLLAGAELMGNADDFVAAMRSVYTYRPGNGLASAIGSSVSSESDGSEKTRSFSLDGALSNDLVNEIIERSQNNGKAQEEMGQHDAGGAAAPSGAAGSRPLYSGGGSGQRTGAAAQGAACDLGGATRKFGAKAVGKLVGIAKKFHTTASKVMEDAKASIADEEARGNTFLDYDSLPEPMKRVYDVYQQYGIDAAFTFMCKDPRVQKALGSVNPSKAYLGIKLMLNTMKDANSFTNGVAVKHEPYHFFHALRAVEAGADMTFTLDEVDDADGFEQTLNYAASKALNLSPEATKKLANDILQHQYAVTAFSALEEELDKRIDAFKNGKGRKGDTEESLAELSNALQTFKGMSYEDQCDFIEQNFPDFQDDIAEECAEEIMAELTSGEGHHHRNLLKLGYSQDIIDTLTEGSRKWSAQQDLIPLEFYRDIDQAAKDLDAWAKNQYNEWVNSEQAQTAPEPDVKMYTRGGRAFLTDQSTGEEILTPHYKAISPEASEYWLSRNVTPEGAINTRTNKEYSKYTTEAERARNGGPIEYQSISDVSIAKTAGENISKGLSEQGYEAVIEAYRSTDAQRLNALETREVVTLAQMIHQELWYRSEHPGKTLYSELSESNNLLADDEAALWAIARTRTGEAASVLRRTTILTPELQTMNNFIQTWAKDKTPESIDPDSDAAKMIQFGQDTIARVQEIEEDFKAGNEEQAKKAMIDVIKEVNKVRNTRGLFADQLIGGKQLGKAMDFVEASLLNRVLRESDFNTIKMMALGSVNRINSDFEKVGKLNTINQLRYANMLSNFATTVNNFLNNLESATTGALANNIAYDLLNKKTTRIMGEQTLVRSDNDWFTRLAIRSDKRAKNKELNRYMWTKGAESVLSLMYGLDVDNGKIDLDLGAKHNQNSGELGQLMARYQFLTGLKMQTTDAMAIARAYKAMEVNIDALPISNERKAELKNLAMQEAKTQMYHNEDNGVAKALLKARETLDKAHIGDSSLGLGSILVPFVQVPVNVATRALEATPAGVVYDLARGSIALHQLRVRADQYSQYQDALEAQKAGEELTDAQKEALEKYANVRKPTDAEVRKAARAIGHAATNSCVFAVALLATALNGLKNFDDEDDDELKRLAKEKGWTGLQINMAAMFRPGHEWKDGDPVVGGSWLEVLSIPFAAAYSVANSWMKEDDDGKKGGPGAALKAIAKSPLTTFSQAIDVIAGMPGVDQFYDMWTAYQNLQKYEPDEDKRIAKETASILQYGANTLASFAIPNSIAMGTAGLDNKVRDVYTADSNWQIMGNIIKNKLPGLRGTLPVARDSLGNVRTYGDNVLMGLVNKSVLPGTGVKIWSRSPLEKEWARLKGEGVGGNLMPKKSAPNNITVDGEKYDFNAEEKRSWDDMNTELCVAGQNILINTEGYKNMTDTEKGAALRDVNTLMALVSNQAALDKKGVDARVELKGWENAYFGDDNGPDMEGLAKYLVAKHTFKSIWDSKAGTFGNLEEADTFIDNIYSKLDQTARDTLDSSYGWLDDFSDARKTTGMSAKEFAAAKEIQEKYRDMQDAMRDMADDDENKESLSALSRNMATEFADYFGDGSKRAKWAQDHLRLWVTISASNDTLEKWQGNTSLSTKEIDSWLDNKSKLVPQGGYKNPSQNQTFMAIRDFNGISASNQDDLEKKRWEMIEMAASKGEDTDGDGEGDGGAWAKLKPYMEQGYSVAYALDHATYWYKQGKRWVRRKYNRIYPKD